MNKQPIHVSGSGQKVLKISMENRHPRNKGEGFNEIERMFRDLFEKVGIESGSFHLEVSPLEVSLNPRTITVRSFDSRSVAVRIRVDHRRGSGWDGHLFGGGKSSQALFEIFAKAAPDQHRRFHLPQVDDAEDEGAEEQVPVRADSDTQPDSETSAALPIEIVSGGQGPQDNLQSMVPESIPLKTMTKFFSVPENLEFTLFALFEASVGQPYGSLNFKEIIRLFQSTWGNVYRVTEATVRALLFQYGLIHKGYLEQLPDIPPGFRLTELSLTLLLRKKSIVETDAEKYRLHFKECSACSRTTSAPVDLVPVSKPKEVPVEPPIPVSGEGNEVLDRLQHLRSAAEKFLLLSEEAKALTARRNKLLEQGQDLETRIAEAELLLADLKQDKERLAASREQLDTSIASKAMEAEKFRDSAEKYDVVKRSLGL